MEATVGIDVSKVSFSVCVLFETSSQVRDFTNDGSGFRKLQSWLRQLGMRSARICLEATNRYWEPLAQFLFEKRHRVSVVNPFRTSAYWKSEHLRAKTDHVDAGMIARFCNAQDPELWQPASKDFVEIRSLVRELEYLKSQYVRLKVRSEHGAGYSISRIMKSMASEIKKLQAHIEDLIKKNSALKKRFRNLQSVPGVGKVTALVVMTEIGDKVNYLDRDQLVAYAGLAPRIFESGTSIRKSKGTSNPGNHRVKRAFFLPVMAAVRVSPVWKQCYDKFIQRGKPKKVALGAIMRKLFITCCGVMKTDTAYAAHLA